MPCHNDSADLQFFVSAGKVVRHLSLFLFSSRFLGSEDHAGFMYVCSTLQSLQGLPLPNQPYLFGLLVHRAEVPWAKAFPLRLMLRLGAEYRCEQCHSVTSSSCNVSSSPPESFTFISVCPVYPCPLYSVRFRKPLFGEIGHTIMRLLVVSIACCNGFHFLQHRIYQHQGEVWCHNFCQTSHCRH